MDAAILRGAPVGRSKGKSTSKRDTRQDIFRDSHHDQDRDKNYDNNRDRNRDTAMRPRRAKGQLAQSMGINLHAEAVDGLAQQAGLTRAGSALMARVCAHLYHWNKPKQEFRLSELARLGGVSPDTVRRAMRLLVEAGLAQRAILGSKGRGLESTWVIEQPLAPMHQVVADLCAEGRLPGYQKSLAGQSRHRRGQAARARGFTRARRAENPQSANREGESSELPALRPLDPPHSMTPSTSTTDGMPPEVGKGTDSLPEVLEGLGFDEQGARVVAAKAPLAKCPELADLLRRLCVGDLPLLASRLSRGERVKNPYGLIGWALHRTPARVREATQAVLVQRDSEARALEAITAQLGLASVPLGLQAPLVVWQRTRAVLPPPESVGYLEAFDIERAAFRAVVQAAEATLTSEVQAELASCIRARLLEAGIKEGGMVWSRAWAHHHSKAILAAAGLPQLDKT